jgi:hypothetical protein
MISPHPSFVAPSNPDVKIWRYTNFAKFTSLLLSMSLFFSRASLLGDPCKGSSTLGTIQEQDRIVRDAPTDPSLKAWNMMPGSQ